MKNYRVVKNDDMWEIIETQTNQIIRSFKDEEKAKKLNRHLKGGGGFNGWTPSFFLLSNRNRMRTALADIE